MLLKAKRCVSFRSGNLAGTEPVTIHLLGVGFALLIGLGAPVYAQTAPSAEEERASAQSAADAAKANCMATGIAEICLRYFQASCQSYGFAGDCALARLGEFCVAGDHDLCNKFAALARANLCHFGDEAACVQLGYLE